MWILPLRPLLKNKLLLQKHFNVIESDIDQWPFWMFEENISIVNELTEEEEKQRKKEEEKQQMNTPNFNPGSYMRDIGNISNKFK